MLQPHIRNGKPHWEGWAKKSNWIYFEEFTEFLKLVWKMQRLPPPTEAQIVIAYTLQHGRDPSEEVAEEPSSRELVIRAFRGLGKSVITASYALWLLMRNPRDEKILVLSATGNKSGEFVKQIKDIIVSHPLCSWLVSGTREGGGERRDLAAKFDVMGSSRSQPPSLEARSIVAGLAGSRATTIICDDIETIENSKTEEAREIILHKVRSDLQAIRSTEQGDGDLLFLGTPQSEESVYNTLVAGVECKCITIPARYPEPDKIENYFITRETDGIEVNILAPYLRKKFDEGVLTHGDPTDQRFGSEELDKRQRTGQTEFALQYMLDTSLSDAERYPLKQKDFIVMPLQIEKAPISVAYGHDQQKANVIRDIPNIGFSGDYLLRPIMTDPQWDRYQFVQMFIDPSGRGNDETAWAVVGFLNGMFFILDVGGINSDFDRSYIKCAEVARRFKVSKILIEPNYSGGAWASAFKPIVRKICPQAVAVQDGDWAVGQKEERIIQCLEPILASHKVVIDEDLVRREARSENIKYSFLYQMTHITHDRGSLRHDDRLDALAGMMAAMQRYVSIDVEEIVRSFHNEKHLQEVERIFHPEPLLEGFDMRGTRDGEFVSFINI